MTKILLFYIPYAGGSAGEFLQLQKYMDEKIIMCPIEYAGHGKRHEEILYCSFEESVNDVYERIVAQLSVGDQYALLGHSMGSIIAYEVYFKLLENNIIKPMHIFYSGSKGPFVEKKLQKVTDEQIFEFLISLGGIPHDLILETDVLRFLMAPAINDLKLLMGYKFHSPVRKTECNISVLNGNSDLGLTSYMGTIWKETTRGFCDTKILKGNHFYFRKNWRKR